MTYCFIRQILKCKQTIHYNVTLSNTRCVYSDYWGSVGYSAIYETGFSDQNTAILSYSDEHLFDKVATLYDDPQLNI